MTSGLVVAPCSFQAAKHAVMNWHYSRVMPVSSLVKYGVWEDGQFIGAVLFSRGSTITYPKTMDVGQFQVCELVRVALRDHVAPVTEIVAKSIKQLKRGSPGLRVILSFADPFHGHHGGIYIAGNWIYLGPSLSHHSDPILSRGRLLHARSVQAILKKSGGRKPDEPVLDAARRILKDPDAYRTVMPNKHRYAYPLDRSMRKSLEAKALPHPVPCERSIEGDTSGPRPEGAGSIPAVRSRKESS